MNAEGALIGAFQGFLLAGGAIAVGMIVVAVFSYFKGGWPWESPY